MNHMRFDSRVRTETGHHITAMNLDLSDEETDALHRLLRDTIEGPVRFPLSPRLRPVNLPFTVEPHPIFRITRIEMESGAGAALARPTVAQINPIGSPVAMMRSEAAVATPGSFH
jgi:hypothetical protein